MHTDSCSPKRNQRTVLLERSFAIAKCQSSQSKFCCYEIDESLPRSYTLTSLKIIEFYGKLSFTDSKEDLKARLEQTSFHIGNRMWENIKFVFHRNRYLNDRILWDAQSFYVSIYKHLRSRSYIHYMRNIEQARKYNNLLESHSCRKLANISMISRIYNQKYCFYLFM